ncbi:Coagulation factor IX [Amphibalanus amphitrite]|uniref:Coagulation factor IX n=1 Tax=Amphibalanus amphitrite TaxID=1232801 RepID=A0A6A4X1S1_AMPAM|nr:Coagulation factor IX [Amphibalanus amphitrite]
MQLRLLLWTLAALAAAAAAAALNVADVPCGKQRAATKIVGGSGARPGQFPWLVSLQLDGEPWCGGTLVSQWFVVTAAHCLKNMKADRFSVVAGEHDLTQHEGKEQRLPVQAIALHPEYRVGKFRHDLAVLRLAQPAVWGGRVQPACLPASDQTEAVLNRTATVAGWGWTAEVRDGGERADRLRTVSVPVMGPLECTDWFAAAGRKNRLHAGQLCAGFKEGGRDGCQGDSGGPLLLPLEGRSTLVGVVSAGIGCGRPGLPGVYTDVSHYMGWIKKMVA